MTAPIHTVPADPPVESDDALLERFQRAAFGYFLETFNPANGLTADTTRPGAPASIAVVGFALSAYPVGVERGWIDQGRGCRPRAQDAAVLLERAAEQRPGRHRPQGLLLPFPGHGDGRAHLAL